MDQAPVTGTETGAAATELRAAPRFALMMRAIKLITQAGEFLCILRDVSETGLKVKLFHALPRAETYHIELGNGDRYAVEPVWQDEGHAGFRFCGDPVDVAELMEEPGEFPRRQLRMRIVAPLPVMVSADGAAQAGLVQDISQNGAALELESALALRQPVSVEAPGIGQVTGRVRWRRGKLHGIVFQEGFRMDQLAQLVARINLGPAGNRGVRRPGAGNLAAR